MSKSRVLIFAVVFLLPTLASAQLSRTAVSVNGSDANSCATTSPCRSFARAMSQTQPGGEIVALDSGGFGTFTADRSVTVDAAPGAYAGVTATSGNGVSVDAGTSGVVTLRHLVINGLGTANAGISATGSAAEVHVEDCVIQGFAGQGIIAFLNTRISNTTIRDCNEGIWIDNAGTPINVLVSDVALKNIGDPAQPATTGDGIRAWRNSTVTVRNAVVGSANNAFIAVQNGVLNLSECTATLSTVGISAELGGTIRLSHSFVTANGTGVSNTASTVDTFGNNAIGGNTADFSGSAMTPLSLS